MDSADESGGEALLQAWKNDPLNSYIHLKFEQHGQGANVAFEMAGTVSETGSGWFRLVGKLCCAEIEYFEGASWKVSQDKVVQLTLSSKAEVSLRVEDNPTIPE